MTDPIERLSYLIKLVGKEDQHLQDVKERLLGDGADINAAWLEKCLSDPTGIDRLESFGAKFSRMQDTVVDKLLPQLLIVSGEIPGAAIDNLNRVERLQLINAADDWIAARRIRNKLVHEYVDDLAEMLPALQYAIEFTQEMHRSFKRIQDFVDKHGWVFKEQ